MDVLSACMPVHHVSVWLPRRLKKKSGPLKTGDNCEMPRGWFELNPDPQEEQAVLVTDHHLSNPTVLLLLLSVFWCGFWEAGLKSACFQGNHLTDSSLAIPENHNSWFLFPLGLYWAPSLGILSFILILTNQPIHFSIHYSTHLSIH